MSDAPDHGPFTSARAPHLAGAGVSRAREAPAAVTPALSHRRRTLEAGAEAESRVEEQLRTDGWALLDANWRGGGGELDRVMTRDGHLRFVEVKLRADDDALADDAVPHHKRSRLRGAARAWMEARPDVPFTSCAFTVAWVDGAGAVRLVDDAFDG